MSAQPTELLIIDGLNVIRRVFEANPADNTPEKVESAMNAAFGSFRRALREHKPRLAIIAMDVEGENWRHRLLPDYRKGRSPMYEGLRDAIPGLLKRLLDELGLRSIAHEGAEADDIIATVADSWVRACNKPVTILSTDKDLLQLCSDQVKVYDHFKNVYRTAEEKFGVGPKLVQDVQGLMGDPVDGIPGVRGVGVKTAVKLVLEHGSLEAVLKAAAEGKIPGAVGKKLVEQSDEACQSYFAAHLKRDLPLGVSSSSFVIENNRVPF